MLATKEVPLTVDHKPHAAFFRQSGWLMTANVSGGLMMFLVHFLNKKIPDSEYSAFGVLLMVVACLPTIPLQMVFAQQTAQALALGRERQLSGIIRLAWLWTFLIWAAGAAAMFIFKDTIVERWHLSNASALLVMLPLLLMSIWMPMFSGVLQGRQDFFWIGWSNILNGGIRLLSAAFLVLAVGLGAAGMMAGALLGVGAAAVITIWRSRDLLALKPEPFDGKSILRQVIPLLLGFGACQVLFTSDSMFAKAYFSGDAMKPYVLAGTLSRALLWFVMPLATVMFPKLVQSAIRGQKSNLFNLVVLGTAVLSACGMLALWVGGPIIVRIMAKPTDVADTMALIPWYAGAMIPLAMANVMVNDLLARSKFAVVPFAILVAIGYCFAMPYMLSHFPGRLEVPLQTVGVFNLLLFGICAVFTWGKFAKKN
jgi:O-antigen/teichoic acid export membrane protein